MIMTLHELGVREQYSNHNIGYVSIIYGMTVSDVHVAK